MNTLIIVVVVVAALGLLALTLAVRIVRQYEQGVVFRLGRLRGSRAPGLREKRAKIINAEGESLAAAALGEASDTMMAHPLALQLRNLQSLVEIGVDKNTTVVFPAPLMSTIEELVAFLTHEDNAARDGKAHSIRQHNGAAASTA